MADFGSMISSFLNPDEAYEAAEEAARKGYGEAQGYLNPYYQHGLDQYGDLNKARQRLMDPAALEAEWAKSYETSPEAQQLLSRNREAGLEGASSMGLMGSSAALGNIQQGAGNIVSADRQRFMNDLMQKYLAGIGLGGSLYGTGASAAGALGENAMRQGENMAGLEYGRQAAPGQFFGQILGKLFGNTFNPYDKSGGGSGSLMDIFKRRGSAFSGAQAGANLYNTGA